MINSIFSNFKKNIYLYPPIIQSAYKRIISIKIEYFVHCLRPLGRVNYYLFQEADISADNNVYLYI